MLTREQAKKAPCPFKISTTMFHHARAETFYTYAGCIAEKCPRWQDFIGEEACRRDPASAECAACTNPVTSECPKRHGFCS